jgi:aryl-alcohol dehydrogenase-like predicted oxidoreductase
MIENIPLVLGTATFGNNYGIANRNELQNNQMVNDLVVIAEKAGIEFFDSAPAYGNAESLLGRYRDSSRSIKVISKISAEESLDFDLMLKSVQRSLERIGVPRLWALLLHDSRALERNTSDKTVWALNSILESRLVERIGISVYSADAAIRAKAKFPTLSVFQIPENVCDRRASTSDELLTLAQNGNYFFVRSIFLQGLLLMEANELPENLSRAGKFIDQIKFLAEQNSTNSLSICLSYANSIPWASGIIIGAATKKQLQDIIVAPRNLKIDWTNKIDTMDNWLIDPRNWS